MYRETESFFKKSHAAFSDTYSLNSYGILAYALIIGNQECKEDSSKEPVAIKVFINENDTIIYSIPSTQKVSLLCRSLTFLL